MSHKDAKCPIKPEMRDLILYSSKVATKWKQVALRLNIPREKVNEIDRDHDCVSDKCYDMFNTWLETKVDACWSKFVRALIDVELIEVAREVCIEKEIGHGVSKAEVQQQQEQQQPEEEQQRPHQQNAQATAMDTRASEPKECSAHGYDTPDSHQQRGTGVDRVDSINDTEVVEDPLHTDKDLKKRYDDCKAEKIMLRHDKLTAQQKKIIADVQAILVVVNETEFLATMCYLKPPDNQKAVLVAQCKTIVGPNTDPRLFYVGKFGACPVAVTQVSQGQGKDAVYQATKSCFQSVVLIAAVGVAAGFPEAGVKLGDVLISDRIHDVSLYKSKDDSCIPRGNILPCSKLMLQILKDHHDWKFPCADSEDETRNSSVKIGLILSRSELLDDPSERKKLRKSFGPEAKGFEMEGFGIMQSNIDCIIIKGVCDFAGNKSKKWQPTAALAANDYLHHHLVKTDLSLLLENEKGHGVSKAEVQQPQQREQQQPEEEQQRPQQQNAQATAMDTRAFEPKECSAHGYDTPDSHQQRDASSDADDKFERGGVNRPQSNGPSRGRGGGAPSRKRKSPYNNNDDDDDNDSGCVMSSVSGVNRNLISSQPSSSWNNGNRNYGRGGSQSFAGGRPPSSLSSGYGNASTSTAHNGSFPSTSMMDSTSDNCVVCSCGNPAVLLTVKNPASSNLGRRFYKCSKRDCDFFLWADSPPSATSSTTIPPSHHGRDSSHSYSWDTGSLSTVGADLTCRCGLKAVKRSVQKEGPNKGRQFYTCAKPRESQCGFFQWSEDSDNTDTISTSTHCTGGAPGYLPPIKKSRNNSNSASGTGTTAKQKCSVCQQEGHTKRNCPQSKYL